MLQGASRSSRLLVAALVWTLVGLGLLIAGGRFAVASGWKPGVAAVLAGLILGALKGRFLLAKIARENASRIESGPATSWIGASFSLSSWGIAGFFMILGMVVRRSGLPVSLIGFVYIAAGFGLFIASCSGWRAWRRFTSGVTDL
ncbi:MAG: hypothetical protein IFK94_04280 [Acidobacteria bacterium]|uniref:Uncharacterized protein n=1 Tax=Candidatus Polarisedimenticola svalbardensis TaxID=2886004 RepID=A0A8J6Y199_9BACT|nr:hypothetical protein [Candidatus Polarisedimenticola svalbardensis]